MLIDPKSVMMNGLRIPLDLTMKQLIYFLFVQQIHYERILKLDGDMRIFDINQIIPVIWGVSLYSETYFEGKITY